MEKYIAAKMVLFFKTEPDKQLQNLSHKLTGAINLVYDREMFQVFGFHHQAMRNVLPEDVFLKYSFLNMGDTKLLLVW